jgi:hypothetical protein
LQGLGGIEHLSCGREAGYTYGASKKSDGKAEAGWHESLRCLDGGGKGLLGGLLSFRKSKVKRKLAKISQVAPSESCKKRYSVGEICATGFSSNRRSTQLYLAHDDRQNVNFLFRLH